MRCRTCWRLVFSHHYHAIAIESEALQSIEYPFDALISHAATRYECTAQLTALCDCLFQVEVDKHNSLPYDQWEIVKVRSRVIITNTIITNMTACAPYLFAAKSRREN